eukprot:1149320-Pyramimonas_sp.AAC.1
MCLAALEGMCLTLALFTLGVTDVLHTRTMVSASSNPVSKNAEGPPTARAPQKRDRSTTTTSPFEPVGLRQYSAVASIKARPAAG